SSSSSSRTCLCSPTTHPGSFRCALHRNSQKVSGKSTSVSINVNRLMNSEVMITSKTNVVKAFLMQIIKPSSRDLQRRRNFQPKPTRFCQMCSNGHGVPVS
ncbi:hypothetical protein CFOL_v3_14404, partial [Cephalotus follicularis]